MAPTDQTTPDHATHIHHVMSAPGLLVAQGGQGAQGALPSSDAIVVPNVVPDVGFV